MLTEKPAHPDNSNGQQDLTGTEPIKIMSPEARKRAAIWLIIGPAALFIAAVVINVTINTIELLRLGTDNPDALLVDPSIATIIADGILQAATVVSLLTFIPSLVAGTVLLATSKRQHP